MNHLTIDLDYFDTKCYLMVDEGMEFLERVFEMFSPSIFKNHHEILPYINCTKYDRIINVDFHSDIADEPVKDLNCGTWANFYKYKEDAVFEWRCPNRKICLEDGYGRCDSDSFSCKSLDRSNLGYKKVYIREGIDRISYNKIKDTSIVLSPEYTEGNLQEWLLEKGYICEGIL